MVVINGVTITPDFKSAEEIVEVQTTFPMPFIDDNVMISLSCADGWVAFTAKNINKNGFAIVCRNEYNGALYRRKISWQAMGYTE